MEQQREVREIVDRTRRIETRLTRFLESQGFDTQVQKPVWRNGQIDIPTAACSIHDCLEVVPKDWKSDQEIEVYHKGEFVMAFFLTPDFD